MPQENESGKIQTENANLDRVRSLVCSDKKVYGTLIAEKTKYE